MSKKHSNVGWIERLAEIFFGEAPTPAPVIDLETEKPAPPPSKENGCGHHHCDGRSDPRCKAGNCTYHCNTWCKDDCVPRTKSLFEDVFGGASGLPPGTYTTTTHTVREKVPPAKQEHRCHDKRCRAVGRHRCHDGDCQAAKSN